MEADKAIPCRYRLSNRAAGVAKVTEIAASYARPTVDPDKLAALRAVVARARRELLDR